MQIKFDTTIQMILKREPISEIYAKWTAQGTNINECVFINV